MPKIAAAFSFLTLLLIGGLQSHAQAPAVSPPVSQTPSSAPSRNTEYTVGAQDVLKVTVFDEPTLTGSYRVDADGSFQYPMLGRVQAGGKKLRYIETDLSRKLEDGFVSSEQVTIDVEQFRSCSIFVVGELRAPGR